MSALKQLLLLFLLLFVVRLSFTEAQSSLENGCTVTKPPSDLNVDPFYTKYCSVEGIPILASDAVPDAALQGAWEIAYYLLQADPSLPSTLIDQQVKIGIIGANEVISDLPDYKVLYEWWPETDWDQRTRGVGATPYLLMSSGAEENLLCYTDDPYQGENIFVHEFAHTVKIMGLQAIDPTFEAAVLDTYNAAMTQGLWQNTYAATNAEEYWAEGIQDYFNVNLQADPTDGIHNFVNTREELADYDPALFSLIDSLYGQLDWQPECRTTQTAALVVECSVTGQDVVNPNRPFALVECPADCPADAVWGTGIYTSDSNLCTAAVHDGVMTTNGGTVTVHYVGGQTEYVGSDQNGITTNSWTAYDSSFEFGTSGE